MHYKINRDALLGALQTVIGVVQTKGTMPILSNILIEAFEDQTLRFTATDLEIELVTTALAEVDTPGVVTVPARKLLDITRGLPEEATINFKQDEAKVQVSAGRSRFKLATLDAEHWPRMESFEGTVSVDMAHEQLKQLLDRTKFAMAQKDVRYYLNGALLELKQQGIRCVATDGHRLALADSEATAPVDEPISVILPSKAVHQTARLTESTEELVTLRVAKNHVRFELGGVTLTSKLIDGRFPDYTRVIPSNNEQTMHAQRDVFRQAVSRASILSKEGMNSVRIGLESNTVNVSARNKDNEQSVDEFEVQYQAEPMEVGFNAGYLSDALMAIETDEFTMDLAGSDGAGLICPVGDDSVRYVLMPVRL